MNSLNISFSVVFPLFCMMGLGYFLKAIHVFNDDFLKQLNNLCFKVFLPLILFINVYNSNLEDEFPLKLVVFATTSITLCFVFLMILVPLFEKDNKKRGVIVQGILRSNYILFGIPITISLFGDANASITAILIAFVIPMFNVFSVIALESFTNKKMSFVKILKQIIKNPLIIASIIAFAFLFTGIKLPFVLEKTVTDISKIATPLALIILGGSFAFSNLKHSVKALTISVVSKLVIIPLIFLPISVFLGFRGMEIAALLALFASPTAVSSFTMAQSSGNDSILAGQIVVLDSVLSVITIFVFINILYPFMI